MLNHAKNILELHCLGHLYKILICITSYIRYLSI